MDGDGCFDGKGRLDGEEVEGFEGFEGGKEDAGGRVVRRVRKKEQEKSCWALAGIGLDWIMPCTVLCI